LDFPFSAYNSIFTWLEGKRLQSVVYPGSFSFRNQSREFLFYDKLAELKRHGVKRESLNFHRLFIGDQDHIARGELRLRRKRVIEKNLDIIRADELYSGEAQDHLKTRYNELLKELIFRSSRKAVKGDFNYKRELDILVYLRENYTRNQVLRYRALKSKDFIIKTFGSIEGFKDVLREAGYTRRYVYEVGRQMREDLKAVREIEKRHGNEGSFSGLYDELYTKFLKVA